MTEQAAEDGGLRSGDGVRRIVREIWAGYWQGDVALTSERDLRVYFAMAEMLVKVLLFIFTFNGDKRLLRGDTGLGNTHTAGDIGLGQGDTLLEMVLVCVVLV